MKARRAVTLCATLALAAGMACGEPATQTGFGIGHQAPDAGGTIVHFPGGDAGLHADATTGGGNGGIASPNPTGPVLGPDAAGTTGTACGVGYDLSGCLCPTAGATQKCYAGNPAQAGVGTCTWGMQTCTANGEFAAWGPCTGSGSPTPLACDGVDHACNGAINQGCACTPGTTQSCYSGPSGTEGIGICTAGTQSCVTSGSGSTWGPCVGQVTPAPTETCDSNVDNTCDGNVGCADPTCNCACAPGTKQSCYTGPPNTEGVGACSAGDQKCEANATGSVWGPCVDQILPGPQNCDDDSDTACDGTPGCSDPACANNAACMIPVVTGIVDAGAEASVPDSATADAMRVVTCNTGGEVSVNGISFAGDCPAALGYAQAGADLCSADQTGACASTFGAGGSLTANCAGSYTVCVRVVSGAACNIVPSTCVTVTIPTDGATAALPAFAGFNVGLDSNACLNATCPGGSIAAALDITGTTTDGIAVNRPDVVQNIDSTVWCMSDSPDAGCGNYGGGDGGF